MLVADLTARDWLVKAKREDLGSLSDTLGVICLGNGAYSQPQTPKQLKATGFRDIN